MRLVAHVRICAGVAGDRHSCRDPKHKYRFYFLHGSGQREK